MARELHTETMPIEQPPPFNLDDDRESDIQRVQRIESKDYLDALAFNEEPVTIRIEQGMEENAPQWHLVHVNGRGAEVLLDGKWMVWGQLPVDKVITTRRKFLEVMLRSKRTVVHSNIHNIDESNHLQRSTSALMAISIIEDRNPLGPEWIRELRRRNY